MISDKQKLLFQKQAEFNKAVGHPLRVAIVDFLKDGQQCVCDIADHVGAERSNISRHLAVMVNAGVLSYRKEGLKVMYSLRAPCVVDFLSCLRGVIRDQVKENDRLLRAI